MDTKSHLINRFGVVSGPDFNRPNDALVSTGVQPLQEWPLGAKAQVTGGPLYGRSKDVP